jgi:hypothetical protein
MAHGDGCPLCRESYGMVPYGYTEENTKCLAMEIVVPKPPCVQSVDKKTICDRSIQTILFKPDGTVVFYYLIRPIKITKKEIKFTGEDADFYTENYNPNDDPPIIPKASLDNMVKLVASMRDDKNSLVYLWTGNIALSARHGLKSNDVILRGV